MKERRRWTNNRPFQARQWRKITHILDKKIIHTPQGQYNRYLVQWEGLTPKKSTWDTTRHFKNI